MNSNREERLFQLVLLKPWVCFQLGVLWGKFVPETQSGQAVCWYQKAIEYLPCYVKARVHLSEIYLDYDQTSQANFTPFYTTIDTRVRFPSPAPAFAKASAWQASLRISRLELMLHRARRSTSDDPLH
jgi:hypothetical protein